jgi:hypothetical protein
MRQNSSAFKPFKTKDLAFSSQILPIFSNSRSCEYPKPNENIVLRKTDDRFLITAMLAKFATKYITRYITTT